MEMHLKTPVSILMELMAQQKQPAPVFFTEHAPTSNLCNLTFKCTVKAGGYITEAYAMNKKDAKQESAKKLLQILGYGTIKSTTITSVISTSRGHSPSTNLRNYVGQLNEYASQGNHMYPSYTENLDLRTGLFVSKCEFLNSTAEGFGPNKKVAKQSAAETMLKMLQTNRIKVLPKKMNTPRNIDIKLDPNFEKVVEQFEKLSTTTTTTTTVVTSGPERLMPQIKADTTTASLLKDLNDMGVKYEILVHQKRPLVLKFTVHGSDLMLMGTGLSYEEALKNLLSQAVLIFKE